MKVRTSSACLLAGVFGATAVGQAGDGTGWYFPRDYREARESFLEASLAAGAAVESIRSPQAGPRGEPLFVDVSLVGPQDAKTVLLLVSGTHGVEGFAGSAIQKGLLREGIAEDLDEDVSVLMVHALNPYGFAHERRFNEDNVDLNRNFVDHSRPYGENPGYVELEGAISPESISFWANVRAILELTWYFMRHGYDALKEAVTGGQHTDPDGLFYGGDSETWSNRTLREIVARYLSGAERVVSVEIHTGLGPFGGAEIILNEANSSPACRRARAWWGDLARSTKSDSVSGDISGSVKLAIPGMLPDTEVTAVSLEFGTYNKAKVLWALRAENRLRHHGAADHPDATKIKNKLRDAFYPDDDEWRAKVWVGGRDIIGQALDGLGGDGTDTAKRYLPGAEPLYLRGGDRGLLLLHGGGGGTAWDMKGFARAAHRRGYTVRVPSLPGYGTQPSDLIGITAEVWLDEVRDGVDRLLRDCGTVAVVAHSVGGVLALVVAAEDRRISRVAVWAAPWKIRNRLLPLLPVISRVPLARRLIPERIPVEIPAHLKEMGWVGYEWLPGSIGLPILDSLKRLREAAGDITCPVLAVQGTQDEVIVVNSAREIYERLPGPDKRILLIEGGTHVLMQGSIKDDLFRETLDFLEQSPGS